MLAHAVLIEIEAAGLELTEGHAAGRLPGPRMTGSTAMKLSSSGWPVVGEMTPTRMSPRGPRIPPGEGRPKRMPSLRPQMSGSPGAWGWIHWEEMASASLAVK